MSWLLGHLLVPAVLSAVLGFVATWLMLVRRGRVAPAAAPLDTQPPARRRASTRPAARPGSPEGIARPAASVPGSWNRVGGSGGGPDAAGGRPQDQTVTALPSRVTPADAPPSDIPARTRRTPALATAQSAPQAPPAPPGRQRRGAPGTTEPARGWGWFEQVSQRTAATQPQPSDGEPRPVPLYLQPIPSARFEGAMLPAAGGAAPEGYPVKVDQGLVSYHLPSSPVYEEIRAEVCFADEEAARRAGFRRWDDTGR